MIDGLEKILNGYCNKKHLKKGMKKETEIHHAEKRKSCIHASRVEKKRSFKQGFIGLFIVAVNCGEQKVHAKYYTKKTAH